MDIRLVVRKVREVIAACIAPQPKQEALVHVPAPTGTWLQVLGAGSGIVRGYHYRCLCGQEYEYSADEAHVSKAHQCEVCKREFSLLRSVDALSTDGSFKSDLAIVFTECRGNSFIESEEDGPATAWQMSRFSAAARADRFFTLTKAEDAALEYSADRGYTVFPALCENCSAVRGSKKVWHVFRERP